MALNFVKGTIVQPGATGNQTINVGAGFAPKVIRMWATPMAAAGTSLAAAINNFAHGCATYRSATVSQWTCCIQSDSTDPSSTAGAHGSFSDALLKMIDATAAVDLEIDLVSMDDDEVVINFVNLHTTASIIIHYEIWGGSDLADALAFVATPTIAATQDISDPAATFGQPDLVMIGSTGATAGTPSTTDPMLSIGWGIKDGAQTVHFWGSDDAGSVALGGYQRLDRIMAGCTVPIALDQEASLSASAAWPTNGVELTWNDQPPNTTDMIGLLFLKGTFQAAIGTGTQPVAGSPPVTQDIALAFTPVGVVTHSLSIAATTALDTSHADLGSFQIGSSDGTNEGTSLYMDGDAEATQRVRHRLSTTKTIEMMSGVGTTYTLLADADAVFQTDNLRFSWTTVNATARQFVYVAVGSGASGAAYSLDCQPGSYTITGVAASPVAGRVVSAAAGSYAVTGAAATPVAGRVVSADPGSYAVTGAAASPLAGRVVNAAPGDYALTGATATLAAGRLFAVDPGTYDITGAAASALAGRVASADPGSYTLTGAAAGVLADRLLNAAPGSYTITGIAAELVFSAGPGQFTLDCQPGSYTLTGTDASTVAGFQSQIGRELELDAQPGGYSVTGNAATFALTYVLSAAAGAYTITGADARLERTAQGPTETAILTGWIAGPAVGRTGTGVTGSISTPETGGIA